MFSTEPVTWRHYLRTALTMSAAVGALLSCSDSISPDKSGTFFGPAVAMGGGTARSYVTLDRAGAPTDLGLALSETALTGLPNATAEFVLALPSQASATPFKHAVIHWMPVGHPPPLVYTVPHFDFHFYTIIEADRTAIVLGDSLLAAKMNRLPAAEFVPAGYILGMASVRRRHDLRRADGGDVLPGDQAGRGRDGAQASRTVRSARVSGDIVHVAYDASAKEYRVALSGLVQR